MNEEKKNDGSIELFNEIIRDLILFPVEINEYTIIIYFVVEQAVPAVSWGLFQ